MDAERTLDPQDWDAMRALGHRMVDDMIDYSLSLRERPAWRHMPSELKKKFKEPVPKAGEPPELVYEEFLEQVLPYPIGSNHPRFWGWVLGTGTVLGAFAEFLAATMNTNTGGGDHHSANHVEKQVLLWCGEMLGFPSSSSGVLTSGCSASNLIGLSVALNAKAGYDVRRKGLGASDRRLILYASTEAHSSIQKGVELLGLGSENLRMIPVDQDFRINIETLTAQLADDKKKGYMPFCVVGTAGTTNTGSIDDLPRLAQLCRKEDLWFHVDGAFGAWAAIAPNDHSLVEGIEQADSLAFDLHKWMYLPYEIGCILVQREEDHRKAFALTPDYLAHGEGGRGAAGGDLPWFSDYGFQLSRGFRALKAWMCIKEHGREQFGRAIQQNIDQARYLSDLIEKSPELELAAPTALNVVSFRYNPGNLTAAALDEVNKHIEIELQEQGIAVVTSTKILGNTVLHAANTNHRSSSKDFEILVQKTIAIGTGYTKNHS